MVFKAVGNVEGFGLTCLALFLVGSVACLLRKAVRKSVPRTWIGVTGGMLLLAVVLLSSSFLSLFTTYETVK